MGVYEISSTNVYVSVSSLFDERPTPVADFESKAAADAEDVYKTDNKTAVNIFVILELTICFTVVALCAKACTLYRLLRQIPPNLKTLLMFCFVVVFAVHNPRCSTVRSSFP